MVSAYITKNCSISLYSYCCNMVVNEVDDTGRIALSLIIGAIYGALLGAVGYFLDISIGFILDWINKKVKLENYWGYVKKKIIWWQLLCSIAIGAAAGALSTTNKAKLMSTIVNLICSIFSAATSGAGVLWSIVIGIITFIIQEAMNSAKSFSKFNFKKLKTNGTKTLGKLNKNKIVELVNAIVYYFKSNKKLYKQCFSTFGAYTLAQWGVIFGVKYTR